MTPEEYNTMPGTWTLSPVKIRVAEKGFRVQYLPAVTTRLDTESDSSESLAEWDGNVVKTRMGSEKLRGKTPHMMRLERPVGLWAAWCC
jgi:hypothetical protein